MQESQLRYFSRATFHSICLGLGYPADKGGPAHAYYRALAALNDRRQPRYSAGELDSYLKTWQDSRDRFARPDHIGFVVFTAFSAPGIDQAATFTAELLWLAGLAKPDEPLPPYYRALIRAAWQEKGYGESGDGLLLKQLLARPVVHLCDTRLQPGSGELGDVAALCDQAVSNSRVHFDFDDANFVPCVICSDLAFQKHVPT